jgi:putative endonuclease
MSDWWEIIRCWLRRDTAGEQGEELAEDFLRREKGFVIVARNWRNPSDRREEIDLVANDGPTLVFVEVKARAAGAMVPGYFAVNKRKKRVLLRACTAYLRRLQPMPRTFRFDVVEVELPADPNARPRIMHFANIPLFPKHFHPGP